MAEPANAVEPGEHDGDEGSASSAPACGHGLAGLAGVETARAACRSLAAFGAWAGWGFAVLGVLDAAGPLVDLAGVGPAGPAVWARAALRAAFLVLAFVLAGRGVAAFARITAASIGEHLERVARLSDHLSVRASEGLALLKRLAEGLEQRREPVVSSTRNDIIKSGLDRLDAARAVNDAEGVLEIHQDLVRSLDEERRAALDRDLAKWFLNLIHRRLRAGNVQADVVRLAARFAENFATTVEGASVRASLPTLRRSVGLCPRCAQPYLGIADACPNCLKGVVQALSAPSSEEETEQPE